MNKQVKIGLILGILLFGIIVVSEASATISTEISVVTVEVIFEKERILFSPVLEVTTAEQKTIKLSGVLTWHYMGMTAAEFHITFPKVRLVNTEAVWVPDSTTKNHYTPVTPFVLEVGPNTDIPPLYTLYLKSTTKGITPQQWTLDLKPFGSQSQESQLPQGQTSGPFPPPPPSTWKVSSYYIWTEDRDREKGEDVPITTYINNYYEYSVGPIWLNFRVDNFEYDDFADVWAYTDEGVNTGAYAPPMYWHPGFMEWIPGVRRIDLTFGPYLESNINNIGLFALNTEVSTYGTYTVDRVRGHIPDVYPYDSNKFGSSWKEFRVHPAVGTPKKVFTVVYYDSEFASLSWIYSVTSFFESAVSHKMIVQTSDWVIVDTYWDGLEELVNHEYIVRLRPPWDLEDTDTTEEMFDHLQNYAGDDLNLPDIWDHTGDGGTLTSDANHGFDCLIGLSGVGSYEPGGGLGSLPGNEAIVQAREPSEGVPQWCHKFGELIMVHELSHNYGADHAEIPFPCIMNGGENHPLYESGWFVHWTGSVEEMTKSFRG